MKHMIVSVKNKMALLVVLCSVLMSATPAQSPVTVRIGDKAPEFKYSKWVKGEPVKSFVGDKLYILEFWATWCGPCKAAMPHLSKLQEENKDKITIIGVDVWEKTGEKPYESAVPAVEKYVQGNETNMKYAVTVDNNDQHMGTNWLKASGNYGIPTTFIIKDEKILWIGHPSKLDSTLQLIIAGTYNMQEYKLTYEKTMDKSARDMSAIQNLMNPITEAIKAKEYTKALELIEQGKKDMPSMKTNFGIMQFGVLIKSDEKKAIEFAKEWEKDFKSAPLYAMSVVYKEDGLKKSTYLWVAQNLEGSGLPMNAAAHDALATTYAKGKDFKNAVMHETKALELARAALKEKTNIGTVMDYTVTEYQAALDAYKKKKMPVKEKK